MQNYNNPAPPPQGGYGMPPQPPARKGMSTGVKILFAAVVLVVGAGALVVALSIGGLYYFSRRVSDVASRSNPTVKGLTATSAGGAEAEPPSPTAEQRAAVAGGQSVGWEQQGITWTAPQKWSKTTADSSSLVWRSPGSRDAASLIANVSPTAPDFPSEISLNAYYESHRRDKQKYDEVRWLKLDGVKGVMFRESAPENAEGPQRLQWIGYREYKGQKQHVTIMLASRGKDFARHEDALYGILYSTKLSQ